MKTRHKDALKVALLGMDERSSKLLRKFFKGPCEGFAEIVDDANAVVDIVDTHFARSEQLVEKSLARVPPRAIIALAFNASARIDRDNLLYLDKPIKADEMMDAIDWASDISKGKVRQKPFFDAKTSSFKSDSAKILKPPAPSPEFKTVSSAIAELQSPALALKTPVAFKDIEQEQKKLIDLQEQRKKAKYRSAIRVDENNFNDFIGLFIGVNINNADERYLAAYDVKNYYQGYVQAAYQSSLARMQTLQLNSSLWKPLVILLHSHEIWVDADDVLLKEMTGVWLDADTMSVTPVDKETVQKINDLEKIQDMYAFLWKMALWTSKGRYPKAIDVDSPVYLRQWPDFPRYVVTPHALRIAGLLVGRGPETMINVASLLNIELRYVYIFISAAHAIGLAAQAKRQVDMLIKTTLPDTPSARKGLLNRIVNRMRKK